MREIVTSMAQFTELCQARDKQMKFYRLCSENTAMVTMAPIKEYQQPFRHGCLMIAALTTAHGRIMLNDLVAKAEASG